MFLPKFAKTLIFLFILLLMAPASAFANSTPVYLEHYPAFNITPAEDCPLVVDHEDLLIQITNNMPSEALFTATYTITNPSGAPLTVPLIFPSVSYGYLNSAPAITLNGDPLEFRVLGGGHVDIPDYLANPAGFKEQVSIEKILHTLNLPPYQAQYFQDTATATLYEVTFVGASERQSEISFNLDPEKTRVLTFGFNGYVIGPTGQCSVQAFVSDNSLNQPAYLVVLGEDTLRDLDITRGDLLVKRNVNFKDFLMEQIALEAASRQYAPGIINYHADDLYPMVIKEIDTFFARSQLVFGYDMIFEHIFVANNISVFLFEVPFEVGSANTLTVSYPATATMDRRESKDYQYIFAYLLNPARGFASFGSLNIRIELSDQSPYLIDSSFPFLEEAPGIYTASFNHLPTEDLIFTTYNKAEVDSAESLSAQLSRYLYSFFYLLYFFWPFLLIVLIGGVVAFAFRRKRQKKPARP